VRPERRTPSGDGGPKDRNGGPGSEAKPQRHLLRGLASRLLTGLTALLCLSALVGGLVSHGTGLAWAGVGPTLKAALAETPPTIDGIISPGEWGTAIPITLNGFKGRIDARTGQLYVLNDSVDLFIGLVLLDPTNAPSDTVEIGIDADHDHQASPGKEDALRYEVGGAVDLYWNGLDWARDTTQHGTVARTYAEGKYTYEFRKPLNSGDPQDMAVAPGAGLGFRIQAVDAEDAFRYPTGSRSHGETNVEWALWADLVLAATPTPAPAPVLSGPAANAQLQVMTTTLIWSNPPEVTQVHVQVIPAQNDGPGVNLILGAAAELRVLPPPLWYGLLPGMSYTWRVRGSTASAPLEERSAFWGPWSEVRTFHTPGRASARLSLVSPADGTVVGGGPPTLRWANDDTDVFYYEVQMSPDIYFGALGPVAPVWHNLVHGGVADPPNSWRTPELAPGTTYHWRIRPRVQGDGAPVGWGPTWRVRT